MISYASCLKSIVVSIKIILLKNSTNYTLEPH
jgi:hypothetical protein